MYQVRNGWGLLHHQITKTGLLGQTFEAVHIHNGQHVALKVQDVGKLVFSSRMIREVLTQGAILAFRSQRHRIPDQRSRARHIYKTARWKRHAHPLGQRNTGKERLFGLGSSWKQLRWDLQEAKSDT